MNSVLKSLAMLPVLLAPYLVPDGSFAQTASDAGATNASASTSNLGPPGPPGLPGLPLKMSGYIEAGGFHDDVSNGYGGWNGTFVRAVAPLGSADTVNAELVDSREFHDNGVLLTVGDTHAFTDRLLTQVSLATSSGGFYLPTARVDAALYMKWLDQLQLVTNVGVSAINSRVGHTDRALTFGAAYYLTLPLVVEAGARVNQSSPGDVHAASGFLAATYGEEGHHFVSLRYGFGREAYQLIGSDQVLADFNSTDVLLTWRQWLAADQGFQLRLDAYQNPYYRRTGLEASWFHDF